MNQPILANKLSEAVREAVLKDRESEFRTHLGASVIGHSCARHVWYHFRWAATEEKLESTEDRDDLARMIRLWARGDREESVFEALLTAAGMQLFTIDQESGEQFRISDFGGHFGGSLDGVGEGLPELPGVWCLLEFKTHNNKSFIKLKKEGVRFSKPQHFAQMQVYMSYRGLQVTLYCAVNKDTDELYFELVYADENVAISYKMRAENVINSPEPLDKVSQNRGWFECRYCEFNLVCWEEDLPLRNCRTCEFAIIDTEDGVWRCGKKRKRKGKKPELSKEEQLKGCDKYSLAPGFK